MMALLSISAVVALALLTWFLYRRFGVDRIAALNERRRTTSRMVGRAELIDGSRHLEVAIALTGSSFFYENADMQGSIDLQWVLEIQYDNAQAMGAHVHAGKVLRLRSKSRSFEFLLPIDTVARWHMMLPPRRATDRVPNAPAADSGLAAQAVTA